jgi:hypothetical protein
MEKGLEDKEPVDGWSRTGKKKVGRLSRGTDIYLDTRQESPLTLTIHSWMALPKEEMYCADFYMQAVVLHDLLTILCVVVKSPNRQQIACVDTHVNSGLFLLLQNQDDV